MDHHAVDDAVGSSFFPPLEEDDYITLDNLSVALTKDSPEQSGSFTLCFWIYFLPSSQPGVVVRQGRPGAQSAIPLLTVDPNRRLTLYPLPPPVHSEMAMNLSSANEDLFTLTADLPVPIGKWVHVACEVDNAEASIHIDSVLVAKREVQYPATTGMGADFGPVLLSGGDGSQSTEGVQGFAHLVKLLSDISVARHYLQSPPVELLLEDYGGLSEDEAEDSDGTTWNIVGGPGHSRSTFSMSVVLMNGCGKIADRRVELEACLVFSDDGAPVPAAPGSEPPLLVLLDGQESDCAAARMRLVQGKASVSLRLSALSSQYGSRLMRVVIRCASSSALPFLQAVSPPIRSVPCVSSKQPQAGEEGQPFRVSPELLAQISALRNGGVPGKQTASEILLAECGPVAAPIPDSVVLQYCMESIGCRAEFLEKLVAAKSQQSIQLFALKVSGHSGCGHTGYQVFIAQQLLSSGSKVWSGLSTAAGDDPHWAAALPLIQKHFQEIAGVSRTFSAQEELFLQQVAFGPSPAHGGPEAQQRMQGPAFWRLWRWLFPVALALNSAQMREAWEGAAGPAFWVHGFVTRQESEELLRSPQGELLPVGTFVLRFPSSRAWPHPDSGALVASFVAAGGAVRHRLLSLSEEVASVQGPGRELCRPFSQVVQVQPELSQASWRRL